MSSDASSTKTELTDKQRAFLVALEGEARGDVRTAMDIAGYARGTRTNDVIHPLRDHIIEAAKSLLAANTHKAVFSLTGVLEDPAQMGARNAVAAASTLLDRVGIVKAEKIEVEARSGGLFILPAKEASADEDSDSA